MNNLCLYDTEVQKLQTVPDTAKPFVHFISIPELIEVCLTGKENVNPISRFLPFGK